MAACQPDFFLGKNGISMKKAQNSVTKVPFLETASYPSMYKSVLCVISILSDNILEDQCSRVKILPKLVIFAAYQGFHYQMGMGENSMTAGTFWCH